jgi:phage virion morphogenesis protein
MAGATIKITVRDQGLRAAFRRLAAADRSLIPAALKSLGELALKQTRRRFQEQKSPDGQAWAALNPEYAKGKRSRKILQELGMRGGLLGTIVYRVEGRRVLIGTNKVYGAIHQFGGTIVPRRGDALVFRLGGKLVMARSVTIPARPYLGASAEDRKEMAELVGELIATRWNAA